MAFLLVSFFALPANAAPTKKTNATLIEYLTEEKTHLTIDINNLKQFIPPKDLEQYNVRVKQVSAMVSMNNAKIETLDGFLDAQSKQLNQYNQRLKTLQQMPLASADKSMQEKVGHVETLITLNKKTIELITDNLNLAKQFQTSLNDEVKQLDLWHQNYLLEDQLKQIKARKDHLHQELNALYQKNILTKNEKLPENNINNQLSLEASLLVNNQHIALIHHQLNLLSLQKNVIKADLLLLKNANTKTLQLVTETYKDTLNQYTSIEAALQKISDFLGKESGLVVDKQLKKTITDLQTSIKSILEQTKVQKELYLKNLEDYQNQLKKLMSSRQILAEYSSGSWLTILHKLSDIPNQFFKYLKAISLKVYDSYNWLDPFPAMILWMVLSGILLLSYGLHRFLKSLNSDKERSSLTGVLYDGAITILLRNIPYLSTIAMLWASFYITNISYANYQLLFNLISIWLIFRVLILIARLTLLERVSDSSGKDVKLYYRLKWLLLFGGWTTALMSFSHTLPLSVLLQDIFNRLFMLFILSVSLVAWKSKDVIPYLIRPLIKGKKRYLRTAISLLVILIPITLFTTAVIGLCGLVNLAWIMSRYQFYFLMVLIGFIFARGLLFDALELLSEWMISSLGNGWLWIEVFLKPIDKILRVALLLVSVMVLFQLFGWHSDSLVLISLEKLAQYTIIDLTGIHITVASSIEFIITLSIFVWAAKWTREFCYRWLFRDAKDAGIRNSLSVFTQYSVILLGGFITLRILGLDFSGMSMILGGLAVGMGFGLRDFASNVVGGIMLLIERPVREGDLISIGEFEGQVSHIGIRAMRVSSWDNTEVLIPNAETFNKPFTNWTHQDSIVRTVIPIKVSRADDPVMVQQLILDVLAIIPEIEPNPPAQVFLKKIDEALIEFEARYFVNLQLHTRVEVRSKVLFAITAQFKAAGVRPPVEPITVEFKEGHGDFFAKNEHSED